MTVTPIAIVLLLTAVLCLGGSVAVVRIGRIRRSQGEALGTTITGAALGLVVLAVIAAAFACGALFTFTTGAAD